MVAVSHYRFLPPLARPQGVRTFLSLKGSSHLERALPLYAFSSASQRPTFSHGACIHSAAVLCCKYMKSAFATLFMVGLLGIAVFGVFSMSRGSEHGHSGCIAATAQGVDCPQEKGALSLVIFHLGAFRSFSTAIVGNGLGGMPLLFLLFLLAVSVRSAREFPYAALRLQPFFAYQCVAYPLPLRQRLTRWLSLHEHSPSIA